jgi:hypothetical protein
MVLYKCFVTLINFGLNDGSGSESELLGTIKSIPWRSYFASKLLELTKNMIF